MRLFNIGDKVILDDQSGTVEAIVMVDGQQTKYDVRYGNTMMLAFEVPEDEIEEYMEQLAKFIQMDRGLSIPGVPVGCDFEIVHQDYSGGKFEKMYGSDV